MTLANRLHIVALAFLRKLNSIPAIMKITAIMMLITKPNIAFERLLLPELDVAFIGTGRSVVLLSSVFLARGFAGSGEVRHSQRVPVQWND